MVWLIITQDFHNTRPHQVVFIMDKFLASNGFDRKVLNKQQVSLPSQNSSLPLPLPKVTCESRNTVSRC